LDAIEEAGLIAPGRTGRMVEKDIYALAENTFGVQKHWHKRIVRSGINTLCIAADDPPVLEIAVDDTVFIDLGPVFDEWEADVGRTYALGPDPRKHQLCADLEPMFEKIKQYFDAHADITGAELYAYAQRSAEAAGWLVGEFPHARIPGDKDHYRISPANLTRMRDPDAAGQVKHWILEVPPGRPRPHLRWLLRTAVGARRVRRQPRMIDAGERLVAWSISLPTNAEGRRAGALSHNATARWVTAR
jgi:Xaa-Pro dipeptidase